MDITHRNVITILRLDVFEVEYETSLVRNVGCAVSTWFDVGPMLRRAMLHLITLRFNEEVRCNSFRGYWGYLLSILLTADVVYVERTGRSIIPPPPLPPV